MAQKPKAKKPKAKKSKKVAKPKAKAANSKAKKAKAKKSKAQRPNAQRPKAQRTETVLPKELELRLMALAAQMDKTMDALLLQALCEFADAWEDHFRTVEVLAEEDERVQIVVKPE